MSKLQHALLVLALASASVSAHAEDAVVQRLSANGGLSSAGSKRLISKVTQRMAKAADTLAAANDPLRVAMSQALFHAPVPPDTMSAAKMRLKLYAGLNESTLEALFAAKPGAVASCVRAVAATQVECEALVAAAGRMSVAQVRNAAGGPAVAVAVVAPVRAQPAPAAGGSHFGHFDSGFKGNAAAAPAPTYAAATPVARQQPAFGARPARAPMAAGAQSGVSQKEAYRLQREAYLARQKAQFEDRKQKLDAANAPADPDAAPAKGAVASAKPASTFAKPAPSAAPVKAAPAKAEVAAAAEPAAAEPAAPTEVAKGSDKPALDGDFLNGLLDDPLGKK